MEIVFATGNANKLADIGALLAPHGINLTARDVDLPEIQGSIEEITLAKCRAAAEAIGEPVLVEDTALCFNALNGMPGPYIKWVLKAIGPEGLHTLLNAYSDKTASAVASIGFCAGPDSEPVLFKGTDEGVIVPARGPRQFGWHTCFEPVRASGSNRSDQKETYAEMDFEVPERRLHQQVAVGKLVAWLKGNKQIIDQA